MDWSKYAPYFTRDEFKCRHTGQCFMQSEFMDKLFALRKEYGKPIIINSGYRSPEHPTEKAKAEPGEHSYGLCADIRSDGKEAYEIMRLAYLHGFTRIGVYQKAGLPRFLHLSVESDKFPQKIVWSS